MAGGGFTPQVGLTPECMSEMLVSVEILPEQGTGTWARVVKRGLEDEVLEGCLQGRTVKLEDHVRSRNGGSSLNPVTSQL